MIKSFTELKVWQKAHSLVLRIYSCTEKFPSKENFGLTSQMRRCAVSIPSNIVEGFKKRTTKNSVNFYNIAEASLEELKYQTILAHDLSYISDDIFTELVISEDEVGKMLHSWKKSQYSPSAYKLTHLPAY